MRIVSATISLCLLSLAWPVFSYAACGEALEETRRALAAEELEIGATEEWVRAAKTVARQRDAALGAAMARPPAGYDRALARRLVELRRSEVEPKRAMLERLRAQHEEARRQWERGRQLLHSQLLKVRAAMQDRSLKREDYCRLREAHLQALQLYRQGIKGYRTGMAFYAEGLDTYGKHFLVPYTQGFTDPQRWQELIRQLERGDFLQDILVPMTANVVRSRPPDEPPE